MIIAYQYIGLTPSTMDDFTRSKTAIYLVGSTKDALTGSKLPSIGDVLRLYLHRVKTSNTKHESAISTIKEVQAYWGKARIPMRRIDHAAKKLEELVGRWEALRKNKRRRTKTQIEKDTFTISFNDLFDVSHQDALTLMNNDEDKQFLLKQREKGRQGAMIGLDDVCLVRKEQRQAKQKETSVGMEGKAECQL